MGAFIKIVAFALLILGAAAGFYYYKLNNVEDRLGILERRVDSIPSSFANVYQDASDSATELKTQAQAAPQDIQALVDQAVKKAIAQLPVQTIQKTIVQTAAPAATPIANLLKETYIPLDGDNVTTSQTWQTLSGMEVYIDSSKYPSNITVTWDAAMQLTSGNGVGFARLVNASNNNAILFGSEISTSSETQVRVVSGSFYLQPGNNLYVVQAYSNTGYQIGVSNPRIKVTIND